MVLAAGLGIDEIAFSKNFKSVISIELNNELNEISEYNFNQLHITNIQRISQDASEYILNNSDDFFDCIYIDPDRRDETSRQVLLKNHSPDVVSLLPNLLLRTALVVVKASPLYDFEMALTELKNVSEFYSISRFGEMKELLIICKNQPTAKEDIKVHCVDVGVNLNHFISDLNHSYLPERSELNHKYFFEAGNSLVKMRQYHAYANSKKWSYIDKNVPYFTSENPDDTILGRSFILIHTFDFSNKSLVQYLKARQIEKINLKVRGLKFSTNDLLKSLKVKEGGDDYIFILPYDSKSKVFHCKKT